MITLSSVKSFLDDYIFLISLQLCLIFVTGIDFIVHSTLYDYGLIFSNTWAVPYWTLLGLVFFGLAFCSVSAYNIDRKKINIYKSILVFITIIAEHNGGILDTLWFVIYRILNGNWGGAFGNWTWHPYSTIGFYNLYSNLTLNVIVIVILTIAWYWVLRRNRKA